MPDGLLSVFTLVDGDGAGIWSLEDAVTEADELVENGDES